MSKWYSVQHYTGTIACISEDSMLSVNIDLETSSRINNLQVVGDKVSAKT